MKAGRELDALIAEKVMGLEPWPEQDPRWKVKAFKAPIVPSGVEPKPCQAPEYSTSIAAAWLVVEKLGLFKDKMLDEYVQLWQTSSGSWIIGDWEDQLFILAEGDTAPEAICLAALKALGVEA